jgi:CRISPR/Cas system CSM-associated protein Csm4 (group 5 of RAMP superfamily)
MGVGQLFLYRQTRFFFPRPFLHLSIRDGERGRGKKKKKEKKSSWKSEKGFARAELASTVLILIYYFVWENKERERGGGERRDKGFLKKKEKKEK